MPTLPTLTTGSTSRDVTDTFFGYNRHLKINAGEWYNTKNLTSDEYPLMSTRKPRGTVKTLTSCQGMISKDALAYVDNGILYVNGEATPLTDISAGQKQLVGMGAYITIWPDKLYYNTEDADDYGSMEATFEYTGQVEYKICQIDGVEYENAIISPTEPTSPTNGQAWVDTSGTTPSLKIYSSSQQDWETVATVYTKLTFTTQGSIPSLFKEYDGVTVSGTYFPDDLDGTKILYAVGGEEGTKNDYIVLIGLIDQSLIDEGETISITRTVPTMDYVCESNNRLWGCFYGNDGTQNLNEIYCCALGDFKNWNQFLGLSTDSYTASVGSDGQWTGAINYLGSPLFSKEGRFHVVSVSSTGAHQITETELRGVQKGCSKSMCIVNETLIYKAREGVVTYQGGFPTGVYDNLGDEIYTDAVAGVLKDTYYVSMMDSDGNWNLFTYNISSGLWMREDDLHATSFCSCGDNLYCSDVSGNLYELSGTEGTLESSFDWLAETGLLYYEYPDKKYVSRYDIRLKADAGSVSKIYIEYDSDGVWRESGTISRSGTGTVMLPIRPRRCDHMRLRFTGTGGVKILSIARILEQGSDA